MASKTSEPGEGCKLKPVLKNPEISPLLPAVDWMKASSAIPVHQPATKSRRITLRLRPGETSDQARAGMAVQGVVANASATAAFQGDDHGELSLDDLTDALQEHGRDVNRADLSGVEQMLAAQAVTLNAIFTQLARRASRNMDSSSHLGAAEVYLRLALKAQGQCRTTLESLAAIKSPPVVIAKQLNVANGPQQVNNQASAIPQSMPTGKQFSAERTERARKHGQTSVD